MPIEIEETTKQSILNTLSKLNQAISEVQYLQEELVFVLTNELQEHVPPGLALDEIEFDLKELGREYPPEVIYIQLRKWAQKYEGQSATPDQRKQVMALLEECMPGRGDTSQDLKEIMLVYLGHTDINQVKDGMVLACLNDWMVDLDEIVLPRETGKDVLRVELGAMLMSALSMPPKKKNYQRYNVYGT